MIIYKTLIQAQNPRRKNLSDISILEEKVLIYISEFMGKVDLTKVKALEVTICQHISYNLNKLKIYLLIFYPSFFSPFPKDDLYLSQD